MHKQTIALIDDDRNILTSLSIALEKEDFKVQTYIDGESALIGLTRTPPDLAVIDIKMPKMDGEELLKKLRKKTSLPVIFLTSKDDEIDELLGLKLGADDFVKKSGGFSIKVLIERIRVQLRKKDSNNILEENKKTQDFYNPYVEFSDNCNYFYKRGKNRGDNCLKRRVNDLYCKEHSKSIFIDKRSLKFCNLQNFDIRNYIYVVDDNEFIKTNASIIICPNHLCDQWVQEYYSKFNNNHRVVLIVTGDQYSNITFGDLLFADIVVISYNFL